MAWSVTLWVTIGAAFGCGSDTEISGGGLDAETSREDTSAGSRDAGGESADVTGAGETGLGEMASDTNPDASGVDSGLAGDRSIETLEATEASAVCEAGERYVRSELTREELCLFFAHASLDPRQYDTDAQLREACSSRHGQCTDRARPPVSEVCQEVTVPEGCASVTVEQWEACEMARTDAFVARLAETSSCSEVTLEEFSSGGDGETRPEACEPIRTHCPELIHQIGPTRASGAGS